MEKIIDIKNLSKRYGKGTLALDNLTLSLSEGQIVGLLGPNGSGKTTLIKVLNGFLRKYDGSVLIDNEAPNPHSRNLISYLPDRNFLPTYMKVKDALSYFKNIFADFDTEIAKQILDKFKIDQNSKVKALSKGTVEKLHLALILGRQAKIYILDEPIAGVDPAAREYIINTILAHYNKKALVIISTHLIDDIETICDYIIFLQNGHIVRHGKRQEIIEETGKTINELFKEDFRC